MAELGAQRDGSGEKTAELAEKKSGSGEKKLGSE
jgi:hypothetical protein